LLTLLTAHPHCFPFHFQRLTPNIVCRCFTAWQENYQHEPLCGGLARHARWTWNHHLFCPYTFGMSRRIFVKHLLIPFQIFFPRSFAKEAGYKAKTISIKSGTQHTVQDYNHSPTSSTWGGANQDFDQPALGPSPYGPSPYGRNTQPEVVSPQQQQHRVLLSQTMPTRHRAPGHGGVGSGPPAWEMGLRSAGDVEAGYHDPNSYIKMDSRPYLGDDKVSSPTVKLGIPKRPQRPATSVMNPLVGISCRLFVTC
jgi:hypothetical protein